MMGRMSSLHLRFKPSFTEGYLAYASMAMDSYHFKDRSKHDIMIYVWEPIVLGQCAILYEDEDPRGFVSWGWLDRDQEERFIRHSSRLRDFAHETKDDVPWILDMIAPHGFRYVSAIVRGLTKEFSNDPEFDGFSCARALRPCGRLVRFRREQKDKIDYELQMQGST